MVRIIKPILAIADRNLGDFYSILSVIEKWIELH